MPRVAYFPQAQAGTRIHTHFSPESLRRFKMTDSPTLRVAIVGAGIAGLGAAIALGRHPTIDVQVYERAAELKEIGASIALGPNGMRTLDRLGVETALDDSIAFRNKSKLPMVYRLVDGQISSTRSESPPLILIRGRPH